MGAAWRIFEARRLGVNLSWDSVSRLFDFGAPPFGVQTVLAAVSTMVWDSTVFVWVCGPACFWRRCALLDPRGLLKTSGFGRTSTLRELRKGDVDRAHASAGPPPLHHDWRLVDTFDHVPLPGCL